MFLRTRRPESVAAVNCCLCTYSFSCIFPPSIFANWGREGGEEEDGKEGYPGGKGEKGRWRVGRRKEKNDKGKDETGEIWVVTQTTFLGNVSFLSN